MNILNKNDNFCCIKQLNYPEFVLIQKLLEENKSTTSMLETLIGDILTVVIHHQDVYPAEFIPEETMKYFLNNKEMSFLYRLMSFYYKGEQISNNMVVAPINSISTEFKNKFMNGKIPLGKIIKGTDHRRIGISANIVHSSHVQHLYTDYKLENQYFPVKKYLIEKNGENWFFICEAFHYRNILKFIKSDLLISDENKVRNVL